MGTSPTTLTKRCGTPGMPSRGRDEDDASKPSVEDYRRHDEYNAPVIFHSTATAQPPSCD